MSLLVSIVPLPLFLDYVIAAILICFSLTHHPVPPHYDYLPYIPGCIFVYILLFPFLLNRFVATVHQVCRPVVFTLRLESNT